MTPDNDDLRHAHERLEQVDRRDRRSMWIILGALAGAVVIAGGVALQTTSEIDRQSDQRVAAQSTAVAAQSTAQAAQSQADTLAEKVAAACKTTGPVHDQLVKAGACQVATAVQQSPATKTTRIKGDPGVAGPAGGTGPGILGTAVADGDLIVTYTDGRTVNAGRVAGARGLPGQTGPTGMPGQVGQPGKDGRSITATTITDGALLVSYSTGASVNLGTVVGPAGSPGIPGTAGKDGAAGAAGLNGADGKNGADGRGVQTVSASSGRLVVTYTDGTSVDAGPLPAGPKGDTGPAGPAGADGASIHSITCGDDGIWTITLTDGRVLTADGCRAPATTTTTTVTDTPTSTAPPTS